MNNTNSLYHRVSLNALRVFDVVATHQSFKLAANELFITPSAVSQQIKTLEKSLGIILFQRSNQKINLTPEGSKYWEDIRPALKTLQVSTDKIFNDYSENHLRISLIPPIAYRIIFPNLSEFKKQYPYLKLSFDVSEKNIIFSETQFDLAIRFDNPPWEDCDHEHLLNIEIQAICNQSIFNNFNLASDIENICNAPLLKMKNTPDAWDDFLNALNLGSATTNNSIEVNDYQNSIEAVINYGVALALFPLEKPLVDIHNLVVIPKLNVPFKQIYAVTPQNYLQTRNVQIFLTWLKSLLKYLN